MFDIHSASLILPLIFQPLRRLRLSLLDPNLLEEHITAIKDGTRVPGFGTSFIAKVGELFGLDGARFEVVLGADGAEERGGCYRGKCEVGCYF